MVEKHEAYKIAWQDESAEGLWCEIEVDFADDCDDNPGDPDDWKVIFRVLPGRPNQYIENLHRIDRVPQCFLKFHDLIVPMENIKKAYQNYARGSSNKGYTLFTGGVNPDRELPPPGPLENGIFSIAWPYKGIKSGVWNVITPPFETENDHKLVKSKEPPEGAFIEIGPHTAFFLACRRFGKIPSHEFKLVYMGIPDLNFDEVAKRDSEETKSTLFEL